MLNAEYGMVSEQLTLRAPKAVDIQRQALVLSGIVLFAALFLQRFGAPLGNKGFSIVGPIGLLVAAIGLLRGTLAFDPSRLFAFLAFVLFVLIGMIDHVARPSGLGGAPSVESLLQFLLLTSFATLSFAHPVDETRFFQLVTRFFALIAVAGILQFAVQFAGISIFAFSEFLPRSILFEAGYNLKIMAGVGTLFKSNGFFLLEPSIFSQFMALALIIEIMAFRRPGYLALFMGGLLLSLSGTGWIVIGAFIVATGIGMGARGLVIALGTLLFLMVALAAALWLAPDLASGVTDRIDEISRPGTSGHARFVTPFWVLSDVMGPDPIRLLVGIGAGVSERLTLQYDYDVNTPIKVAMEYGVPTLVAYVLLFILGKRTTLQRVLVVPVLVLFFLTGGYQQLAPVLFPVLLIISVARLTPTPRYTAARAPAAL